MAIDVLFIHPGNQKRIYQDLSRQLTAVAPPTWTLLLAQHVRNQGHTAAIYDVNVHGWDEDVPSELIAKHQPRLIIMMVYGHNPSASTQTMPAAGMIARDIKDCNRDIPVAMGGLHPSALSQRTLKEEDIDFVIQGEGHSSIDGLLEYVNSKTEIKNVPGLWFRRDNDIEFTFPAANAACLDEQLDGYAWDLLGDLNSYRAHNMHCFGAFQNSHCDDFTDVRSPYATIYTSLGCPYSCHYCCINAVFDKPGIRYWSVDKVVSWIDTLVNDYGIRNIRLEDELFILSPKRVELFCDMIIGRGYDLNFWAYGRVDTIKIRLLKKLKQAGVNWICLGIEAANAAVRNDVNKNIRVDIKEVVRQIQRHDIAVLGNYMLGLPEDTAETMEQTLQLALDLNCEYANFYSVMAFPGSQLYETAMKNNLQLSDRWEGYAQLAHDTQPLPTRHVSAGEVLHFRDQAFRRYFENPRYLNMVQSRFGLKVTDHIAQMLEITLERELVPSSVSFNR